MIDIYKVSVMDQGTSRLVQEHAFDLGFRWISRNRRYFLDANFLFFAKWSGFLFRKKRITRTSNYLQFDVRDSKELTPLEFLELTKKDVNSEIKKIKKIYL